MKKLFFLSFALCITAASVSAQLPLTSATSTAPAKSLASSVSSDPTRYAPAGQITSMPGASVSAPSVAVAAAPAAPGSAPGMPITPMIAAVPPAVPAVVSVEPHIESREVDRSIVGEVHCKPLYISTVHLPVDVTSVAVGAPTLFTAEHVENEPRLVYVSPTTHDVAESNLLIGLSNGETVSLKLTSSGTSASKYDVDFVLDYTASKSLLAFAGPLETGLATSSPMGAAFLKAAPGMRGLPVTRDVRTVQPISVIDSALSTQSVIATPTWITADDLVRLDKANANATRAIAASLGRVVQVGDTMMASYSVLNVSRQWVQVLTPQIQLGNPVQKKPSKKGILAQPVSIQDFRQDVAKLGPGERLDGVVQFSRPGFKQSKETLLLQIATADAVDHPLMVPLPFVAPGF